MREWAETNLESSRKLVLSLIKYADIDRAQLLKEIAEINEELEKIDQTEEKTKLYNEMMLRLKKEETKIMERKTFKFQRDRND